MDVLMPQLGETVSEGKIIKWFKAVGDNVAAGDNLCEIETDKVTVEVPAISAGIIRAINVDEGSVVPVGAVIAVLGGSDSAAAEAYGSSGEAVVSTPAPAPAPAPVIDTASRCGFTAPQPRPVRGSRHAAAQFRPGAPGQRRARDTARPPSRRRCRDRSRGHRRLRRPWPHNRQGRPAGGGRPAGSRSLARPRRDLRRIDRRRSISAARTPSCRSTPCGARLPGA